MFLSKWKCKKLCVWHKLISNTTLLQPIQFQFFYLTSKFLLLTSLLVEDDDHVLFCLNHKYTRRGNNHYTIVPILAIKMDAFQLSIGNGEKNPFPFCMRYNFFAASSLNFFWNYK